MSQKVTYKLTRPWHT